MGDHSKSKSFSVCGCVCVLDMQHFQCRRMFSGFYKWLLFDKILGRIKNKQTNKQAVHFACNIVYSLESYYFIL